MAVIFAAGGTGGHLIPALTVAKGLPFKPHFIVSSKPVDQKLLSESIYEHSCLPLTGRRSLLNWLQASSETFKVLRKLKPKVVVGFGGFVSVLPVMLGRLLNSKCILFEAELEFGKANKFLKHFASVIMTTERISECEKCVETGYPVREEFFSIAPKQISAPLTVFVQGGSQGSEFFDLTLSKMLLRDDRVKKILHQTRAENLEQVRRIYGQSSKEFVVTDFFPRPWEQLYECDLVITRAGAGSVYEVFVSGRPWVAVPFPFSAGDHQRKNAAWLLNNSRQGVVLEQADKEFEQKLSGFITNLLSDQTSSSMLYDSRPQMVMDKFKSSVVRMRDLIMSFLG